MAESKKRFPNQDLYKALYKFFNQEARDFPGNRWRKRSIPTHSEWLYPLTFDAGKGLKEA